jgi:hypothetical protein
MKTSKKPKPSLIGTTRALNKLVKEVAKVRSEVAANSLHIHEVSGRLHDHSIQVANQLKKIDHATQKPGIIAQPNAIVEVVKAKKGKKQ